MDKRSDKKEFLLVFLIFIIAVAVRFAFSNFVKTIHSYPDELRYFGLARSLFMGTGLSLRNMNSGFQKVGYSLLIAPSFFVKNEFLRIKLISLINCVVLCSSVFPVVGIGREIALGKKRTLLLVFITLLWPDMATSMTFMAEILYWPLCLTFVWLWLYSCRVQKWLLFILLACLCYIGYLCKEIFLAFFISVSIFTVIRPIVNFLYERTSKVSFFTYFSKTLIINNCIFVTVFLVLHIICKQLFFKDLGNSYNQMGISVIENTYNFFYMIFAFFIYIAAVIISLCVFPIVYPVVYYKRYSKEGQNLLVFSLLAVFIIAATVAYTISVREDLGSLLPALHMRYVAPMLIVVMAVFLKTCQSRIFDNNNFLHINFMLLLVLFFVGSTFKGLGSLPCTLSWYKIPQKLFATIDNGHEFVLRPYIIIVNFCFALAVLLLHFIKEKKGVDQFFKIFMFLNCILLLASNAISIKSFKDGYSADKDIINELQKLNKFFSKGENPPHVLYISAGELANENGYFDTYFDNVKNLYFAKENDALCKKIPVSNVMLREPESNKAYSISRIDYIIIPSTLSLECENCVFRDDLGGRYYDVYENVKPFEISVSQKPYRKVSFDWNICISNGFDRDGVRNLDYDGSSFGPYWHLQKGSYEIKINGENLDGADIVLYSAKGSVQYPFEAFRSNSEISLRFLLNSDVDNFEIYIKNKSKKVLKMQSLLLMNR